MLAGLAVLLCAGTVHADSVFMTPTGAVDTTGSPVSATVDFSLSGSTLTVTLTNLQANQKDAGQLLTDVFFSLSAGSAMLSTQTGDLIDLNSGGSVTNLGTGTLGWGFGAATVNGNSGFELCVICQGGVTATATPHEGIVGPGPYTNANSSIAGNGPHNPLINQTATFTFTGVTPGATISNVYFSFGTTPGDNVSAPEPASLLLLGVGLFGLAAVSRRARVSA